MVHALDSLLRALDAGRPVDVASLPMEGRSLVATLLRGPRARAALLALRRLLDATPERWWLDEPCGTRLASLLSSGPELSRLLLRRPERLRWLRDADLHRSWSVQQLREALEARLLADTTPEQLRSELARFRNDHYIRLAAREFSAVPLETVCAELADLADVLLDAAVTRITAAHIERHGPPVCREPTAERCRLAVIALGKYGARELNFCSDVDVLFVYSSDEGSAGDLSLHEFFASICRGVVETMSARSDEGFSFRVDLRLRPEGSRGPICNSLEGAERYYETWGGPYDRLTWLKARAAAGDLELGEHMCAVLRPFVFPRAHGVEVVEQIQQLSRRIRDELFGRNVVEGWDVKLGAGGIRDIEFFVQALQLVHGGKRAALQEPATLRALDKLLFAGLISESEHRQLAEAYELYRRLEHRLQLYGGRQTHLFPDEGAIREVVVAHLGYDDRVLETELTKHRRNVRAIYATVGESGDAPARLEQLLERDLDPQSGAELMRELGFCDDKWAAEQLRLLRRKPWGPFGDQAPAWRRRLAARILDELAGSPDPDGALRHFVDLSLRYGRYEGLWSLLADHPPALRLLCSLLGTSDLLAALLLSQPDLFDALLLAGQSELDRGPAQLREDLARRLADPAGDTERTLGEIERFRGEQLLRIGLHDIWGDLEVEQVCEQLSDVATVVLERVYAVVREEMVRRYGRPRERGGQQARMAVVGLGKLGGRELSYGSDLDLIFVYSAAGQSDGQRVLSNHDYFARLAQRLIRTLTSASVYGSLYQVDTRLRPSGSQGTLVASLAGFEDYHAHRAQLWERQVLIKARAVAGDPELGRELEQRIEHLVYERPFDHHQLRREITRLRARIEEELAGETRSRYNLKLGRGGLVDAEMSAQYVQLRHGRREPALRVRSTLEALRAASDHSLIDDSTARDLIGGFCFMRRLQGRLQIVRGRSAEHVPAHPSATLDMLARRLGYRSKGERGAGAQLLEAYREHAAALRAAYRRVVRV